MVSSKKVKDSSIEGHHYEIYPNDLNSNNTVFGGRIMEIADMLAAVCAKKHSGKTCATLIVDSLRFLSPAKRGEILVFYAAVNRAWSTSMEVGIKVVALCKESKPRKVVSAFFTLVSLDEKNKPSPTVSVIPESSEEKRRFEEAELRRQKRISDAKIKQKQREKKKNSL